MRRLQSGSRENPLQRCIFSCPEQLPIGVDSLIGEYAAAGSRTISMNGAAARRVQVGDRVIIAAYARFNPKEADVFKPRLVYLNEENVVERTSAAIPAQVA